MSILGRLSLRPEFGRDPHPARSQRRIIGALSGLVFSGMMVGINASSGAVATEIISEAPPAAPGAARVVLVDSTTTTTAVGTEAAPTTLVADTTLPDAAPITENAASPGRGPTITVRRGTATTVRPSTPGAPVTNPPATQPPAGPTPTSPPATSPPVTSPPVTSPPVTSPPVTSPPSTSPPTTAPPSTTEPPSTTLPEEP